MPKVRFIVAWSETSSVTFEESDERKVGEIVDVIKARESLPETDSNGDLIEYMLFRENQGHREPLVRSRTLGQAHVQNRDQLYLANQKQVWWGRPGATPLGTPPGATGSRGGNSDQSGRRTPQEGLDYRCRLQFADDCIITVPIEGLHLTRNYLLNTLPGRIVAMEKARMFAGLESPLMRVGRERHCQILRQGDIWLLRAYKPTYVNGQTIERGMTVTLTQSTVIVLGREGWPVQIILATT